MSGFRTPYSTPTEEQAALVGHIVMDWAIVEFNLRHLAARLSFTPDLPGRSLTEGLTSYAAIERITWLLNLHADHYGDAVISYDIRLMISAAVKRAKDVRGERNAFAHHISFRSSDDEIDFFQLGGVRPEPKNYSNVMQVHQLKALRRKVAAANEGELYR